MTVIDDANKGLKTIQQTCQRIGIPIDTYINEARKVLNDKNRSIYPTFCKAFCGLETALENMKNEVNKHRSFRTHLPFTIQTLGSDCDQAYDKLSKACTWFFEQASDEVEASARLGISSMSLLHTDHAV